MWIINGNQNCFKHKSWKFVIYRPFQVPVVFMLITQMIIACSFMLKSGVYFVTSKNTTQYYKKYLSKDVLLYKKNDKLCG